MSSSLKPPTTGAECIAAVRAKTDRVMLAFSGGKDAVYSWIKIRAAFAEVVPYYYYLVPGLEFVEETLDYYERFFGTKILRVPNALLYAALREGLHQTPGQQEIIDRADLPTFTKDEMRLWLAEDRKLSGWTAVGLRRDDNLHRRMVFKRHGPMSEGAKIFYPIFDVTKDALLEGLRSAGVKMAVDYQVFGRTFDGIDYRFLAPIRKHFPRDYARIMEWFPAVDAEFARASFHARRNAHA